MFGLYPAGPQWIKFFSSTVDARALQRSLVDDAGFTAGIFHQPFGTQRGFAVAQRERFLVLADSLERAEPELVVVPDVEMQNLLWSFNTGYSGQWSARELLALTGQSEWNGLIRAASTALASIGDTVEQAAAGRLSRPSVAPAPVMEIWPDDGNEAWLPPDYTYDAPFQEELSCVR
ncbi:hypothetical protein [Burkholderia vietnamiensis]|uniref:hypothetical protein n=1 Tax=Burkholderia vietnamiensis TaxID=60552 RepID=UPI00075F0F4A|nr:hypothetical protein [Burkholderia vietnamiensis]KVF62676.1 hypothetical protein WJ17_29305 [Burkholderia vietnamiensis]KVS21168.1 hypothetical protein WK34_22580 [Burkholderia vietnamiensis]MBR7914055.1 hypothetical protein [Burkholderia vietnamiensis]MBR8001823.1 hypothetical protein [Burkholderia vietnamiensis]MBR8015895.1 hypothetical protein [Burkholderia vietnamiensis]